MDRSLIFVVTGLGVLLSCFSFVVIFRGRPIPGDKGKAQELGFKGLKLKTNGVVMLLVVSVIVAVLPLGLQAWLLSREPAPSQPEPLRIFVTGQVLDETGPVEGATVTVTNLKTSKPGEPPVPLHTVTTDGGGVFDLPPLPLEEGDRYRVVASKEGFVEQVVYMGPGGAVGFKTVLIAKKH
jgi:hypothetical protein